jgi:hypothetical protein
MSQARLYLDEDSMRKSLVFGLKTRNVDVLTASEAGMINRDDQDHLTVAAESARTLYTYNIADYCILHQAWVSRQQSHAGIVVTRQQRYSVARNFDV